MKNEIKYFSMFSGVGGFECGLERANNIRRCSEECSEDDGLQPGTDSGDGTRGRTYSSGCKRASSINVQKIRRGQEAQEGIDKERERLHAISSEDSGIKERCRNEHNNSGINKREFTCVGMSELDKYSSQVLRHRFPNIKNWGDCTKIRPEDLPDFDMLCGGFPCQTFSIAGKRKGFEDIRGTMFFEIARILKVKRPEIVLLENVKGLLNHAKGQTFRVILQTLDELGYEVQWMVLNSKFFGVPQNRERVFIVGNLRGRRRPKILPFKESCLPFNEMGQQVSSTIHSSYYKQGGRDQQYVPECRRLPETKGNSQGLRVYKTKGVSKAITSNGGGLGAKTGLYLDGMEIRRLTPKECERLQGFSDDWTKYGMDEKGDAVELSNSQRYKQMGNAVTVNVIEAIGARLSTSYAI